MCDSLRGKNIGLIDWWIGYKFYNFCNVIIWGIMIIFNCLKIIFKILKGRFDW